MFGRTSSCSDSGDMSATSSLRGSTFPHPALEVDFKGTHSALVNTRGSTDHLALGQSGLMLHEAFGK